jgi:hypothetical protein
MFWGAFSSNGPLPLVPLAGTMTSGRYVETLEVNLIPYLDMQPLASIPVFQHDNAPSHTAMETRAFLQENAVEVLEWPPYSPDLNPIENLWAVLKNKLREDNITSRVDLLNKAQEIWNGAFIRTVCERLVASMPRRLKECIKNQGGYTRY